MTQNEKELLLKDLSARVPYEVKIRVEYPYLKEEEWHPEILCWSDLLRLYVANTSIILEEFKPYLFPMSSLTNEQRNDFPFESSLLNAFVNGYISLFEDEELTVDDIIRMMDWFNKKHIDYRGLIPMGLAIDATNLNIY